VKYLTPVWVGCVLALSVGTASAAVSVTLSAPASSVLLGETIQITATAQDTLNPGATFLYRFNVRPTGTTPYYIMRDFYEFNGFTWAPQQLEGIFDVQVIVQSSAGGTASALMNINVISRVTGSTPAVSNSTNPLVAFYSAPPCANGTQVSVRFRGAGDATYQQTPYKYCDGVHSVNFFIGGMRANTTYTMYQISTSGATGPQLSYTSGSLPGSFNTYGPYNLHPAPASDTTYPIELHCSSTPYATDLQERVVWFMPVNLGAGYLVRAVPGGTFVGIEDADTYDDQKMLKEFDMAGNTIRETNWVILNQELNAYRAAHNLSPATVRLNYISHEGHELPNGYFMMMASEERVANQGQGNVDVLGDVIMVLDSNFQLTWAWDSFDFLNIDRMALQNNKCTPGQAGCPLYLFNKQPNGQPYTVANDWTHANSIAQDPSDGNLIISLRHQAWVIKVYYNNGTGDGHIMWHLGNQGDFTLAGGLPSSDWFNYQHDVEFQSNGLLTLFDNNNLEGTDSRGQAWSLNESTMAATLVQNYDLGVHSYALGSAQWLPNGNFWFGAGFINTDETQSTEFTPSGAIVFQDQTDTWTYRTFRIPSMYDE